MRNLCHDHEKPRSRVEFTLDAVMNIIVKAQIAVELIKLQGLLHVA